MGDCMETKKRGFGRASSVFGVLGLCAMVAAVWLALGNRNAGPVLVEQPEAARSRVVEAMDALCSRDYDTLSGCLYGTPELGLDREPADAAGKLIWDALAGSYRYELAEGIHATDSGVAMHLTISALDVNSVTADLRTRSQSLLEQRVQAAEDPAQVYDEAGEYREDFVMEVLCDAVEAAIADDGTEVSWNVTLNLVYENGQWWIMPEGELLEAISGGILG